MDHLRKYPPPGVIGLMIVATGICMYLTGCSGPQQIVAPDASELSTSNVGQGQRNGLTLRAAVLNEEQEIRLLRVSIASRAITPILFIISNETEISHLIRREHFTLRIGQLHIEPALPGRAAALLGDHMGSQGAAVAGFLIFGILAAPGIDAAEKKEAASVEKHLEVIFSEANLPPGGTVTGYLFFESPSNLKKIQHFELELRIAGVPETLISVQLSNPYANP